VRERTQTLAREEARKDAILRTALDCIISMDAHGHVVEWNPAAEQTFGWEREEVLGRVLADVIIPARLRDEHEAGLSLYLETGEERVIGKRVELTAVRRNGEEFPVEVAITVIKIEDGQLFTAHLRDITERKRAEQELRESRDAARAGSDAKSSFVATMSHEIRTPMNAVIGMLELLGFSKLNPDQREMLTAARESSRALLTLIDDILDFSKIEVGKLELHLEPASIERLVDGVITTFKHVASSKGVLLTSRVDSGLWPAHRVDPSRLRQILANLVSNAIKFTAEGTVHLEVQVLESAQGRQTLRFNVHDTGIGMTPETQKRLFEPFQQGEQSTSRRFGGTGLGLAISRQLAELMGGSMRVTSTKGLGTRVSLTLGVEQADAGAVRHDAAGGRRQAPMAIHTAAGTKVLIVDDHPLNLAMLKRQLKVLGVSADTATGGEEALAKWRREAHRLVITDLQMPGMDGLAFARALRAEQSEARKPTLVAFTANTQSEALERCMAAGMDDYLTKPTELTVLREKLTYWLGKPLSLRPISATRQKASSEKLIDRARIQELAGGPDGIAEVLSGLEAALRTDIAELHESLVRGDLAAVRGAAHRIKGAALNIGSERLAATAKEVEAATRNAADAQAAAEALLDELSSVLMAARA
jgi:PAS domain S-box-containing protein